MVGVFPARGDLDIQFDYRYDARGFFSGANLGRRQILEAAAAVFEERIRSTPPEIRPGGINTWTLSFPNPNSGVLVTLKDLVVPAGTMTVYVGARKLSGDWVGYADYNYTYYGNAAWVRLFSNKDNASNFSPFGGSIAFDVDAPWYFDATPETPDSFPGQIDFYSVVLHELGHLLGFISGARAFAALSQFDEFYGAHASELYGGPVPLDSKGGHWRQDVLFEGEPVSMAPNFAFNERKEFTELDFAALVDIGYIVSPPSVGPLVITRVVTGGGTVTLGWNGGTPPFRVQARSAVDEGPWQDVGLPTGERSLTLEVSADRAFHRVVDANE